eukprot:3263251-Rhodomonas_salina.1
MKWRDGRRDRFTRLTLRMDEASGSLPAFSPSAFALMSGTDTGRACVQDCAWDGSGLPWLLCCGGALQRSSRSDRMDTGTSMLHPALLSCTLSARLPCTDFWCVECQTYELRRGSILMEVWGYARREGEGGRVVSRGQYHLVDSLGRRGCFIMRPVLLPSFPPFPFFPSFPPLPYLPSLPHLIPSPSLHFFCSPFIPPSSTRVFLPLLSLDAHPLPSFPPHLLTSSPPHLLASSPPRLLPFTILSLPLSPQ